VEAVVVSSERTRGTELDKDTQRRPKEVVPDFNQSHQSFTHNHAWQYHRINSTEGLGSSNRKGIELGYLGEG